MWRECFKAKPEGQGFKTGGGECEESLDPPRFKRMGCYVETGVKMNRTAPDLGYVSSLSVSTKLMVNGIVFPAVSPDLVS